MFGFGKKKADRVYDVLQPLIAIQTRFKGIPPGFWQDPFVIGYFSFFSRYLLKELFGGRMAPEESGSIVSSVMQRLSNMNGESIIRNINNYGGQSHPEFEHGADMAAVLAFYMGGKMSAATKPYLDKALSIVTQNGGKPDTGLMTSTLFKMTFQDEITQRFPM